MVVSQNNFPTGAGIASSAAAFAALSLASSRALGLELAEKDLSRLARLGSGSACRSVPAGFVEWNAGTGDGNSYAFSVAPPQHWDLVDCITVVASGHKSVGSTEGHALAGSSPLQAARVADAPRRLDLARRALLERDFPALAEIVEQDSSMMHAVMMTSSPPLYYWEPAFIGDYEIRPGLAQRRPALLFHPGCRRQRARHLPCRSRRGGISPAGKNPGSHPGAPGSSRRAGEDRRITRLSNLKSGFHKKVIH